MSDEGKEDGDTSQLKSYVDLEAVSKKIGHADGKAATLHCLCRLSGALLSHYCVRHCRG